MISRRKFLGYSAASSMLFSLRNTPVYGFFHQPENKISDFCRRLIPIGRILETKGYYVWGTSPVKAPDGKVHVFYSRWNADRGMGGWLNASEIAHAVADSPESPFEYTETVLTPRVKDTGMVPHATIRISRRWMANTACFISGIQTERWTPKESD